MLEELEEENDLADETDNNTNNPSKAEEGMPKRSPFDKKRKSTQDVERENQDRELQEKERQLGPLGSIPRKS